MPLLRYSIWPLFFLLFFAVKGQSQTYVIKGVVYDSSRNFPLEMVSVMATSGSGTVTNSDGYYEIRVTEKDSIWFSYLNKPTIKFPVLKISNPMQFDISLQVSVPVLKEVKVFPRNYKLDSIRNRQDYAKIFNYQKPGLKLVSPQYGAGVGLDLDELINVFRFRRNKSMLAFQQRLLLQEEEKFIDYRFNKAMVRRLTLLEGADLERFMQQYRPSYIFTKLSGDYEFRYYIKQCLYRYKRGLPPLIQEEEPLLQ